MFQFSDVKTQQRYILQEEINTSRRELTSLDDSLRDFLKTFDHASKCLQTPLTKPKFEIGYTKSKDNNFAHYYNDIIERPKRQIRLSFPFGNNNSSVFSIKKFELNCNQFILTELSTLTIAKFTISARTDITLKTSVKKSTAITMCSAFTPDCGYDNSTIILIGDVCCPDTKCSGKLFLHKSTFQSLGRSDFQAPQCACVPGAQYSF